MTRKPGLSVEPARYPWLCAAAGALAFAASLPGKLFWDSEVLITQNVFLREWSYLPKLWTTSVMAGGGIPTNFYRPVATTLLLVCYQLWGPNPLGYHLLNVSLHALNAALVYLTSEKLLEDKRAALWVALIFAIHPLQSEQVNYPDHVEGILAMTFGLASVLAYLRAGSPLATAGFYALALLSKEEGAVFGPILGLLWLRAPRERRDWKALAPAALVALAYVGLRLTALDFLDQPIAEFGAQRGAYAPLALRLLTFAKALLLYARLFVAPFGLHFDRDLPPAGWTDAAAWASLAACAALFVGLWKASDARARMGVLWFFVALLPYCGLVPFNNVAAEHFLYIPSAGLLVALVPLVRRGAQAVLAAPARAALAAALVAAFIVQDARRSREWQQPERIYATTLAGNPRSYRAAANLGVERFRAGRLDEAAALFEQSRRLKPDYAVALNNLGAVHEAQGRPQAAGALYAEAVKHQPDYVLARRNLAGILIEEDRHAEAVEQLERALSTHPAYDGAWKLLGLALLKKGDLPRAQAAWRRGLELSPDEITARRLASLERYMLERELEYRRRASAGRAQIQP